ncbi:MAG TPA: hypothetical protein PLT27_01745 [Nitrospira sp.]|nr:hypothetical protein [Nitrospira sp.]
MRQDMMKDESHRNTVESKQTDNTRERTLTYDETKAAEAAFRGEPFNPAWSAAAATVYAGIMEAMEKRLMAVAVESEVAEECLAGR